MLLDGNDNNNQNKTMTGKYEFTNREWIKLKSISGIIIYSALSANDGIDELEEKKLLQYMNKQSTKAEFDLVARMLEYDSIFEETMEGVRRRSKSDNKAMLDKGLAILSENATAREIEEYKKRIKKVVKKLWENRDGLTENELETWKKIKKWLSDSDARDIPDVAIDDGTTTISEYIRYKPQKNINVDRYVVYDDYSVIWETYAIPKGEKKPLYIIEAYVDTKKMDNVVPYDESPRIYQILTPDRKQAEIRVGEYYLKNTVFEEQWNNISRQLTVQIAHNDEIVETHIFTFIGKHKGDFAFKIPELIQTMQHLNDNILINKEEQEVAPKKNEANEDKHEED